MKKYLFLLALLCGVASAQYGNPGPVSTTNAIGFLGGANTTVTDADCDIVAQTGCTTTAASIFPIVTRFQTINLIGTWTSSHNVFVALQQGGIYCISNPTGFTAMLGGHTGSNVPVPSGSQGCARSYDGANYVADGGGTPGSPANSVQYNNGGVFAGDPDFTYVSTGRYLFGTPDFAGSDVEVLGTASTIEGQNSALQASWLLEATGGTDNSGALSLNEGTSGAPMVYLDGSVGTGTFASLTSGNCVQASTGGLLTTTAAPCGTPSGSAGGDLSGSYPNPTVTQGQGGKLLIGTGGSGTPGGLIFNPGGTTGTSPYFKIVNTGGTTNSWFGTNSDVTLFSQNFNTQTGAADDATKSQTFFNMAVGTGPAVITLIGTSGGGGALASLATFATSGDTIGTSGFNIPLTVYGGITSNSVTTGTLTATSNSTLEAISSYSIAGNTAVSFNLISSSTTGTGATITCQTSHVCDQISGEVVLVTGTGITGAGSMFFINHNTNRINSPNCLVTSQYPGPSINWGTSNSATHTMEVFGTLLTASTTYVFDYLCGGN